MYTYIHIYIYIHMYICTYVHIYLYTCIHSIYTHIHTHTYTCIYIYLFIYLFTYIYIYTYAYIHICIYTCLVFILLTANALPFCQLCWRISAMGQRQTEAKAASSPKDEKIKQQESRPSKYCIVVDCKQFDRPRIVTRLQLKIITAWAGIQFGTKLKRRLHQAQRMKRSSNKNPDQASNLIAQEL